MMQEHDPNGSFYLAQKELKIPNNLDFLRSVLSEVEPQEKTVILKELIKLSTTDNGERSRRAIAALFSSAHPRRFKSEIDTLRIRREELGQFLDLPPIVKLADIMLRKPDKYAYQLGILLPLIEKIEEKLPENLQKFKKDNSQLKVIPEYMNWALCEKTEERMANAIRDKAVVIVNGFLAFKFEGKMCGLAVENTITETGHTFIRGNFYTPTNYEQRNLLKDKFIKGKTNLNLDHGQWLILRSAANNQNINRERLLTQASDYVETPPESLSERIDGYSHTRYLGKMFEPYTS